MFGYNGLTVSLGRYDFAAPTRAIAISESGEGLSVRWRRFTVSHVIRPREKADKGVVPVPEGAPALFATSPDSRDRWTVLGQAQFAPKWLRIEFSGLLGRLKTLKGTEGHYYTVGGDLMAANGFGQNTPLVWRMNGGLYVSHREAKASAVDAIDGDKGWAGLVDGSVAWLKDRKPRLTFGGTFALASRDDTTTTRNEGYAGESGAFGPDKIFLATLAGKVATFSTVDVNGEAHDRKLNGGLTGKKYFGASIVYQGFSPLEWLAFGVPDSDIHTPSVTLRWHGYRLRNPVSAVAGDSPQSWLGHEMSMEWLLESPSGVRYTLTGAYFVPGGLLKAQKLILSRTWYMDARVTVTLR